MKKTDIPIFFSVDDNYLPYLAVTLESIKKYASREYNYIIKVLHSNTVCQKNQDTIIETYNKEPFEIEFVDISAKLEDISEKLYTRDYYSKSTYYRLFIPTLYPNFSKALYLDCDIVVLDDISKLYNTELGTNLVAGAPEEVMALIKVFGDYVEQGLDIKVDRYINAGIIVMNLEQMRKENFEQKFLDLLGKFKFEVTQDQDYLNVMCKDRISYVDLGWNKTSIPNPSFNDDNLKIVHYKMTNKPWRYDNIIYGDYFWDFAKNTPYYQVFIDEKKNHTKEKKEKDKISYDKLCKLAENYINDSNNYKRSKERK